jgi:hypothetical protein
VTAHPLLRINFIVRQSDDDLACLAIHESRTILKLYLDESDLKNLSKEIDHAMGHLRKSRNIADLVTRNLKKTRFPRGKVKK